MPPSYNGFWFDAGGLEGEVASGSLLFLADNKVNTGWAPEGDDTRGFDFTVTVNSALDETFMDKTVTDVDLIWSVDTTS